MYGIELFERQAFGDGKSVNSPLDRNTGSHEIDIDNILLRVAIVGQIGLVFCSIRMIGVGVKLLSLEFSMLFF